MGGLIRGYKKHLTVPHPGWQRTDPLDRGLVGEWRFDPATGLVVPDYSGRGNHGTVTIRTGGSWQWSGSEYGMALYLDHAVAGTGYYVNIADNPALDGMGALTVEVFSRNDSAGPDDFPRLVTKGNCYTIAYERASGTYYAAVYTGAGNTQWVNTNTTMDVWNHFVLTFDGAGQQDYANGVAGGNAVLAGPINANANALHFGAADILNQLHEGFFGLVRIYNRALTAGEVSARYELCLKRADPMTHVWMIPQGAVTAIPRIPRHPAAYNTLAIY